MDLCRLGWVPATVVLGALTLSTIYSGHLLLRLYNAVPNAVLFGDIGEAAAGSRVSCAFISLLHKQRLPVKWSCACKRTLDSVHH